ncbi:MAG: tetratricopeptide repeat protein, partial [Xanthobacteraceae bacterium]
LGLAYTDGDGVPQDDAEAARWFRLAADKGYPKAQLHLGLAYADGRGVPRDLINAYMWVVLSGMRGVDGRTVSQARNTVEEEMTPEQIDAAQKLALAWKPKPCGMRNLWFVLTTALARYCRPRLATPFFEFVSTGSILNL